MYWCVRCIGFVMQFKYTLHLLEKSKHTTSQRKSRHVYAQAKMHARLVHSQYRETRNSSMDHSTPAWGNNMIYFTTNTLSDHTTPRRSVRRTLLLPIVRAGVLSSV